VPSQQSLQISDEQMRQLKECITSSQSHPVLTAAQFQSLEGLLTTETATHSQPLCPDAAALANSASWANVMPLLFLQSDFRFPVGLSLEDAYRRWFCAVPPLPPLHMISAKMIPPCESRQHRKAQKSLRSKFAGCMQVIHGLTPPGICRRNVAFTWSIFWPRIVSLYSIREPCSWTVATAFQKFYSDKSKQATAINMPALAIEDVPVSCSEPSVAWTAATSISETASTALQQCLLHCGECKAAGRSALDAAVLSQLHDLLLEINPWVRQFRSAGMNNVPESNVLRPRAAKRCAPRQ
jgi:hypothetical protein